MLDLIISLILIIFFHELAHFLIAKLVGCEVEVFSIGFGPALISKQIGNTVYQLALIPLGGFCKLKGELDLSNTKGSFGACRYRDKLAIVLAGCTINLLMGGMVLLFAPFFDLGGPWLGFSALSIALGITNLLPIPALDGSYPILLWFPKWFGAKRGVALMQQLVKWGFIFINVINVLCIPFLIRYCLQYYNLVK